MTTPPVPPPPGNYPPPGYAHPIYPAVPMLPKAAYTSWLTRVVAYFIDAVPVFVLISTGLALMWVTAARNDCVSERSDQSYGLSCTAQPSSLGLLLLTALSLAALAFGIWNYGYRQGKTGSSIGKSIMKFKVVGEVTGQPIGFGMSLLRQLAHVVDGMFCNIGYLFPLWDAKRQTIADKIMSTVCLPTD